MGDLLAKIQGIEDAVNDVHALLREYTGSRNRQASDAVPHRKRRQPSWAARIDHKISRLTQELQEIKEKIESSPNAAHDAAVSNHDFVPSPEAQTTTPDQPPNGSPQQSGGSPSAIERAKGVDSSVSAAGAKTALGSSFAVQPDETERNEAQVRATMPGNQVSSALNADQHGVGVLDEGTDPVSSMAIPSRSRSCDTSAMFGSNIAAQGIPQIPHVPNINIPFRMEGEVAVLMPSNMDQCRDAQFLLSQATALGARETGVFKYVLPDDFNLNARIVPSVTTHVSRFKSCPRSDGVFQLCRTDKVETLEICDATFPSLEPCKLAENLENHLVDPVAMEKMRYCTDIPA